MVSPLPVRDFAGLRVTPTRLDQLLATVAAAIDSRERLRVTYLNPDYALQALRGPRLLRAINGFDVVLVDGNGVRLLTPLFGFGVPERLDTDKVAPALFRMLARQGRSVYLFGCAPGVAAAGANRLVAALPDLRVVGTEHGFHDQQRGHRGRFDSQDSERIVEAINASGADVLIVSLPTPLQQRWVSEYANRLRVPVVMTGGSYLDHLAAAEHLDQPWYPRWADRLRLNWFYRLLQEPRRLLRRYTLNIAVFTVLVVRRRLASLVPALRPAAD